MKRPLGLVLALLLCAVPRLWAQASTGNIYGSVADASGAVLPGATITIRNTGTGQTRTTTTNETGGYVANLMPPGTYEISASIAGFQQLQKTGIDLPDEVSGVMPSEEWKIKNFKQKWYAGETISVGIGQEPMGFPATQNHNSVTVAMHPDGGSHAIFRGCLPGPTEPATSGF